MLLALGVMAITTSYILIIQRHRLDVLDRDLLNLKDVLLDLNKDVLDLKKDVLYLKKDLYKMIDSLPELLDSLPEPKNYDKELDDIRSDIDAIDLAIAFQTTNVERPVKTDKTAKLGSKIGALASDAITGSGYTVPGQDDHHIPTNLLARDMGEENRGKE